MPKPTFQVFSDTNTKVISGYTAPVPGKTKVIIDKIETVMGTQAGAGSGEFHMYLNSRNREKFRIENIESEKKKEEAEMVFKEKIERNKLLDEERLKRNVEKRKRLKEKKLKVMNKKKKEVTTDGRADGKDEDKDEDDDIDTEEEIGVVREDNRVVIKNVLKEDEEISHKVAVDEVDQRG
jgi:hypothetical protein